MNWRFQRFLCISAYMATVSTRRSLDFSVFRHTSISTGTSGNFTYREKNYQKCLLIIAATGLRRYQEKRTHREGVLSFLFITSGALGVSVWLYLG